MAQLDYAQAGVNRQLADKLVERIAVLTKPTLNKKVKASIGGYASLYELNKKTWLAASTDGVGTKLKLAFRVKQHHTVGIDLVAMSVNDLLCVGAQPLFFLDYFATGKLDSGVAEKVLEGIVEGCRQAKCALVGGETAEMPDMYQAGEYDLGGFAVGMVDPSRVLPKKEIQAGDVIIGIRSSGVHSNGFSLLRKLIPAGFTGDEKARELLEPTKIYVNSIAPLLKSRALKGLAHITGSGFLNVPRISTKFSYEIHMPPRNKLPSVYEWIRSATQAPLSELAQTFNLGIGMVAVVSAKKSSEILKKLAHSGEDAWAIGVVRTHRTQKCCEVIFHDQATMAVLTY